MMTHSSDAGGARPSRGRPKAEHGRKLPPDEVERLLVEGELVTGDDGVERRVWPSQRDLAKRYGVAPSLVGAFSTARECAARRKAFQAGIPAPPPAPPKAPGTPPNGSDFEAHQRGPGRPRRTEGPAFPHDQVFDALVYGEVEQRDDGTTTTIYPSYRELAARHGVAVSVIANYAKSRNVLKRRELAATRIEARKEDKLIELRSEAFAFGEARMLTTIDEFAAGFEAAVKEGRVRFDNPADLDKLWRLKSFIQGGADSRQEIRGTISLEALQQRYETMQRNTRDTTVAMTGYVPRARIEGGVVVVDMEPDENGTAAPRARSTEQASPISNGPPLSTVRRLINLAERVCMNLSEEDAEDESRPEVQLLRLTRQLRADLEAREHAEIHEDSGDDEEAGP